MKKHVFLIGLISMALIFGMILISCGGGSPSSVVKQLHTAIEKGDAKKIGDLTTPEAAQMLAMFGEKGRGMITTKGSITKTEETINGNNAVVKVTYKNGETDKYDLVKVNGKWKVSLDK